MPQQQRPVQLRHVDFTRDIELAQLLTEAPDRSLQVGQRLA